MPWASHMHMTDSKSIGLCGAQVLCNLLGKPPGELFCELQGEHSEFQVGDVQYHLGQRQNLKFPVQVWDSSNICSAVQCRAVQSSKWRNGAASVLFTYGAGGSLNTLAPCSF